MNTNLVQYYKDRAKEYENIYSKPERQEDLAKATKLVQELFKNKEVFEIACGTGYWTERIARTASSVFATDINREVIEVAEQKNYPRKNVRYKTADLYSYEAEKQYEQLFAGFIWSHIRREEIGTFIKAMNKFVLPGGTLVIMDNNFVSGSSTPLSDTDENANTYQTRFLKDGSSHRVLKNFPTESYLREVLEPFAREIKLFQLQYFWIAVVNLK